MLFYAMAAINGGVAKAAHVHFDSSQGDVKFLRVLEKWDVRLLTSRMEFV